MSREEEIKKLAEVMHEEYEKASKRVGWKTQESCQVKFANLPEKNRRTMLFVAGKIYERYINAKDKRIEILSQKLQNLFCRMEELAEIWDVPDAQTLAEWRKEIQQALKGKTDG